jgi:hypothetical protein
VAQDVSAQVLDKLARLAHQRTGLLVGLIDNGDGQIQVGVLGLIDLEPTDWFYSPVPLDHFAAIGNEVAAEVVFSK